MRCKKVNRNSKQKKWRKKLTCVMNKNKRKNAKEKKYQFFGVFSECCVFVILRKNGLFVQNGNKILE